MLVLIPLTDGDPMSILRVCQHTAPLNRLRTFSASSLVPGLLESER
jgi:hypothetical protein